MNKEIIKEEDIKEIIKKIQEIMVEKMLGVVDIEEITMTINEGKRSITTINRIIIQQKEGNIKDKERREIIIKTKDDRNIKEERREIIIKTIDDRNIKEERREIIIKTKDDRNIKDKEKREIIIKTIGDSIKVKEENRMKEDMIEIKITKRIHGIIDRITSRSMKKIKEEITTMIEEIISKKIDIKKRNKK
jgi:hypothetical protein